MASDVEDDDLENLRKAALATLKPKALPISSISTISRTQPHQNSSWLEFPVNNDIVPEYQYQPDPLPEPDLLLDVSVAPPVPRPHLPLPNLPGWPGGFNYRIPGEKIFRPRGFPADRRPFNPRSRHRSFGDRGRSFRERGRYPRRGYATDRGQGFFSGGRGRAVGPLIYQFPPPETDNAGGNLIVINPQPKDNEENKDIITGSINNNPSQGASQEAPSKPKLLLPQDKYHTPASSTAVSEKTSAEPLPSKPRDKFSRFDDSDSEEEDDWTDILGEADDTVKIDIDLEEDGESDSRVVEEPDSCDKEFDDAAEGTYEVEIRKLEFSDNEEEESEQKIVDVDVGPCSPVSSDNESIDLDVLAGEQLAVGDSIDSNKNISEEEMLNVEGTDTFVQDMIHTASVTETEGKAAEVPSITDGVTNEADEKVSDLLSSSSSSSSSSASSSSSSSSSSDSSTEDEDDDDEDDDKTDNDEQKISESDLVKKSPSSVSSAPTVGGETRSQISVPKENVSSSVQEKISSPQQNQSSKYMPSHVTSPPYSAASSKILSPVRKTHSSQGHLASPRRSYTPPRRELSPLRRSTSPRRPVLSPNKAWSPRRSRSRTPRVSPLHWKNSSPPRRNLSSRQSPLSLSKGRLSPRRSLSPRRVSLSPPRGPSPRHLSPRSYSPRLKSASHHRSLSPGRKSVSPRRRSSRQKSLSPVRPRRRSVSPTRSPLQYKRSRSPIRQSGSPSYMSTQYRHSGYRDASRDRQGRWERGQRATKNRDDSKYDQDRSNYSRYSSSNRSREREQHDRSDHNPRYRQSWSTERRNNKHTESSNLIGNSHGKHDQSSQQKDIAKEVRGEEPSLPQIDLEKLTPEERAKIEARRKKFSSSEVKIDPAKKVSLKSIKERTKKRKKSQQELSMRVSETHNRGRKKSEERKADKRRIPEQEESGSGDEDKKYAALEEDSEDSDTGRQWRLEAKKTKRNPDKFDHSVSSLDRIPINSLNSKSRRERTDIFQRRQHRRERSLPNKHRERLPGFQQYDGFVSEDDNSEGAVGSNRLTSSVVTAKPFEPDIPPEKLRVEIQVLPKEKKSKKSKAKPDFSKVYSVPAKRQIETHTEMKATIELSSDSSKKAKKKKKNKKVKHAKMAPEPAEGSAEAVTSDEESEQTVEPPAPRLSVLERLGKKVPFKPHKERKKKKKKKSHSDEEYPTELDAKIRKIKEKNAAIARRQREIELDKKKYG